MHMHTHTHTHITYTHTQQQHKIHAKTHNTAYTHTHTHTHTHTLTHTHTQGPSFGIIVKHWGRDVAHLVELGAWQAADAGQHPCVVTQGIFLPVSA